MSSPPPGGGDRMSQGDRQAGNPAIQPQGRSSYSDRLKTNVRFDQRLKRNVLEITLEKSDPSVDINVDFEDVARVCKTLGIDISTQVQGSQIQYSGQVMIKIWMAAGISLDRFCKDVGIRVTDDVITGIIRPAGKKDVTVSIVGLDFNTPDSFVTDYLSKFGTVLNITVIYSKFESGPFKGKYNGERKYQVDFSKAAKQMGTYHLIDGAKVRVFYRGNQKTCGRCHKLSSDCPGDAIAKNCAAGNGERVFLSDHMKKLWQEINFVPTSFSLDESDKSEDDVQQASKDEGKLSNTRFPPSRKVQDPSTRDIEFMDGICVRNFPKTLSDNELKTFLINHGIPQDHDSGKIKINRNERNSSVIIRDITPAVVQALFSAIHFHETKQKFFDVPIFCKPLRNMTPTKAKEATETSDARTSETPKKNDNSISLVLKPKIPGLPEKERLKQEKKNNKNAKNTKKTEKSISEMSPKDFLKSVETAGFVFTEPDDDEGSEDSDENFEDSKDSITDDEESPGEAPFEDELKTPANVAPPIATRPQPQT